MNIVHLVSTDVGGAARAANRISNGLSLSNIPNLKSKLLVANKTTGDADIETIITNKKLKLKMIVNNYLNNLTVSRFKKSSLFSNAKLGFDVTNNDFTRNADVINLHWINQGMISYKSLKQLKKLNKPIVWTLHDMWPFTGGCHYDENCRRYKNSCGECKVLGSNKNRDMSTRIQKKKEKLYKDMNITVVGCSRWITECAKESKLFKDNTCINIPNAIDVSTFKPIDKDLSRNILNINTNKKIILFGAMSSTSDKRKGFKYLLEAIKNIDSNKYMAIIFGSNSKESKIDECLETLYLGKLSDDYSLALLYSAADVFVAPSEQENLANTVMESLSCGTPVVAFNIGGMSDMIKHKHNGYLARPFNVDELIEGIEWSIENNSILSKNSRDYIIDNYTYEIVGKKYADLYNMLYSTKDDL